VGTHALILGASTYLPAAKKRFGLGDLDCPVLSALRMARWLLESYQSASDAPLASLRLLLSPSELEERSLTAQSDLEGVARCTGDNVESALYEWLQDLDASNGNVAVLYGAGHGVRYRGDGPVLLLEDFWKVPGFRNALDIPKSNLGLDGLRLRASFLFADCCQQIDEVVERLDLSQPLFAPSDPAQPQRRLSWGLYRAAAGNTNAYGVRGNTTHFVEALIEGLNGRSATSDDSPRWEVTTDSLKMTLPGLVEERFKNQRARGTSEGEQPGGFHRLEAPPKADLSVLVDPDRYAASTSGSIDRQGTVLEPHFTFSDNPYRRKLLESGSYRVAVEASPPVRFLQPVQDVAVKPFRGGNATFEVYQ
jgi:hypothetical protein